MIARTGSVLVIVLGLAAPGLAGAASPASPAPADSAAHRAPAAHDSAAARRDSSRAVPGSSGAGTDTAATRTPHGAVADTTASRTTARRAAADSTARRIARRGAAADSTARRRAAARRSPARTLASLDPRFRRWLRAAGLVDTAHVMRIGARPRVARDSVGPYIEGWDTFVASEGRGSHAWVGRFLALARDSGRFEAGHVCRPDEPDVDPPGELMLGVRFGARATSPSAVVMLRERCIQLREGQTLAGRMALECSDSTVVALAREALPDDSLLGHVHIVRHPPAPVATPAPAAPPPAPPRAVRPAAPATPPPSRPGAALPDSAHVAALPDTSLPAYGQYVQLDRLPEAVDRPPVIYPDSAKSAHVQGTVIVSVLVGADGIVKDARVQQSIPALDAAALQTVRRWRFRPGSSKGRSVAAWVPVPVKFNLP